MPVYQERKNISHSCSKVIGILCGELSVGVKAIKS